MDYRFKPSWKESPIPEERRKQIEKLDLNSTPPVHDNQQLREANAKLKEFIDRMSCGTSFDWLFNPVLVMLMVFMCWVQNQVVLAIAVLIFSICLLVYIHYSLVSFRQQISVSGLTAGVLYKIMMGPDELGKIYQYVPIPWRWFFLMLKPKKVADWVFLVAQNLAWYQQEPRFYLPTRWIIQTVLGTMAVCFIAMVIIGNSTNYDGHEFLYYFISYNTVMLMVDWGYKMKLAGAIALRAELQSVLPPRNRTPLKAEDN